MSLDSLFTDPDHNTRIAGAQCPIVLFASASGGAGSTVATLTSAEISAGAIGIQKVLVFDAVKESGSVALALRMYEDSPTISTALLHRKSSAGIIPASKVNNYRSDRFPAISFDVALQPQNSDSVESKASNLDMVKMIETLRQSSNLILIDCGSLTYDDREDSALSFIGELLQTGKAFLVLALEPTFVSSRRAENIATALQQRYGISTRDRVMTLVNKVPPYFSRETMWPTLQRQLASYSHPLSPVSLDAVGIMQPMSRGKLPTGQAELASPLAQALFRATNLPGFEDIAESTSDEARRIGAVDRTVGSTVLKAATPEPEKASRSLFGRRR